MHCLPLVSTAVDSYVTSRKFNTLWTCFKEKLSHCLHEWGGVLKCIVSPCACRDKDCRDAVQAELCLSNGGQGPTAAWSA